VNSLSSSQSLSAPSRRNNSSHSSGSTAGYESRLSGAHTPASVCPTSRNIEAAQIAGLTTSLQLSKFFGAHSQLSQYFIEKWRSDLTTAVDRDRYRASVLMDPALMTSGLTTPFKTKPQSSATELLSAALGIHDFGAVCRQR
jgi:hypothetical protein